MSTPARALERLIEVFEELGVPYMVGGSLASSVHGIARPTMAVDIVAALQPAQADSLAASVRSEFYADPDMIQEALERKRPFNLIHLPSSFKFDVFPVLPDEYHQLQFQRRTVVESVQFGGRALRCTVATAEDMVLAKLEWYRAGGEVSERQWQDLLGIVRVRGATLDTGYLRHWARVLGVADLLERLEPERPIP